MLVNASIQKIYSVSPFIDLMSLMSLYSASSLLFSAGIVSVQLSENT